MTRITCRAPETIGPSWLPLAEAIKGSVDWEQASAQLPDWHESHRRIVADGTSADLTDASDANASRNLPPPVENLST